MANQNPNEKKISLRLSGGANNRTQNEFLAPLPTQGSEPSLLASTNTRLSRVQGGVTRSPAATQLPYDATLQRYGLLSARAAHKTLLANNNGNNFSALENWAITGDGDGADGASDLTSQRAFVMGQISDAGAITGFTACGPVAQAYDPSTGVIWRAFYAPAEVPSIPRLSTLIVTAQHADGRVYASTLNPGFILDLNTIVPWVGITVHPSGVFVWANANVGASLAITCTKFYLSGTALGMFPGVTIAAPTQPLVAPDVVAAGDYAYLAMSSVTDASAGTVRRYAMSTVTVVNEISVPGALAGSGWCAIHAVTMRSTQYVVTAFSRNTGRATKVGLYSDTLSTVGAAVDVDGAGPTSVKHIDYVERILVFISSATANFSATPATFGTGSPVNDFVGTRLATFNPFAAWSPLNLVFFPWERLHSQGTQWQGKAGSTGPVMLFAPAFGLGTVLPGETDSADDPSLVAYYFGGDPAVGAGYVPVARFACVRGISQPVQTFANEYFASSSEITIDTNTLCFAWRKIYNYTTAPFSGFPRFTTLDLTPRQVPTVDDKDGATLAACAYPTLYDGTDLPELGGPIAGPHLAVTTHFDSGGVFPAGVYRFAAFYEWADASGTQHRSRPSATVTLTTGALIQFATIYVTTPHLYVRSINRVRVALYASQTNGTTLHLIGRTTVPNGNGPVAIEFTFTTPPEGDEPQIYSTGTANEEITPQPPPPLRDIAIIASRCWGIDAEFPTRIVFSKFRVAGFGYEFFPAGEVNLPSEAGEAMAVREWGGLPLIFAERGVYQVSGDGPDNTGQGSYTSPVKVSNIGCSNTASVVVFPNDIMWQSGRRFARMATPTGIDYDDELDCTHDVSAAVHMPRHEEVLFFSDTIAEVRVWNYAVKRWTTWDSDTLPETVRMARALPWDLDKVLVYSANAGVVRRIDADSVSSATHMTFKTDHIVLDGDFQSHVIVRDVIFSGAISGPHDLTIEVYMDYEATPSTSETWTSAVLAAKAINGRYTVRRELTQPNGRAVQAVIRDAVPAGNTQGGMSPRAVTLLYTIDGQVFEEVFDATVHR